MRFALARTQLFCVLLLVLSACSESGGVPPVTVNGSGNVVDSATQPCTVSEDGAISYALPAGQFSPIDLGRPSSCPGLGSNPAPSIPSWAKPRGSTQTVFVATSLQEEFSIIGMQNIENFAAADHVPMTWMIGNPEFLKYASTYNQYHAANGDTVAAEDNDGLIAQMHVDFPWFVDSVSVQGAGHERDISGLMARGENGFWGITWDSQGIDGTADMGAPWGTYCADSMSYKRPEPNGGCKLLAFEWTARDLTRAYLSALNFYYSTDVDDLLDRAKFTITGAQQYMQELADAYAAAGVTQPIVMVSQDETHDYEVTPNEAQVLSALYKRAVGDGMKVETLPQADIDARAFSANPRAVAFPYIPGGAYEAPSITDGGTLYPATIDYHDTQVGMTFLAGHTLPEREFVYANDPVSIYNKPFGELPASQYPKIKSAAASNGSLVIQLEAPIALHTGVALWVDSFKMGISGPNVTPAGHGGVVITANLQTGVNQITIPCAACTSTVLPYST